jgi:excisionase family DNA binding protein
LLKLLSPEAQADLVKLIDERVAEHPLVASPASPTSPWLTVAEAAEFLRTTEHAVYKRIKRGQLQAHRPDGSRILLHRDDLVITGPAASGVL